MFEKVKATLAKQLNIDPAKVTLESRFKEDLGADSIDILQLLLTIEEDYGVTIPDEKLATFSTVGDIVNFLSSL